MKNCKHRTDKQIVNDYIMDIMGLARIRAEDNDTNLKESAETIERLTKAWTMVNQIDVDRHQKRIDTTLRVAKIALVVIGFGCSMGLEMNGSLITNHGRALVSAPAKALGNLVKL